MQNLNAFMTNCSFLPIHCFLINHLLFFSFALTHKINWVTCTEGPEFLAWACLINKATVDIHDVVEHDSWVVPPAGRLWVSWFYPYFPQVIQIWKFRDNRCCLTKIHKLSDVSNILHVYNNVLFKLVKCQNKHWFRFKYAFFFSIIYLNCKPTVVHLQWCHWRSLQI